jgi:hypothetical protein
MHASVRHKLPEFLTLYEGKYHHMYLDVKGLVTIGIGFLIDPVDEALKLQYKTKGGGMAGQAEVKAEWTKVKARKDLIKKGGPAFASITTLELSDQGIRTMFVKKSEAAAKWYVNNAAAKMYYGAFDSWPADAQMALLGIAWGIAPIPQFGWRALPEACKREDWMKAADECRIKGAPEGRNRGHKLMFQNAHYVKENKSDIRKLWWPSQLVQKTVIRG